MRAAAAATGTVIALNFFLLTSFDKDRGAAAPQAAALNSRCDHFVYPLNSATLQYHLQTFSAERYALDFVIDGPKKKKNWRKMLTKHKSWNILKLLLSLTLENSLNSQ